MKKLWLIGVIAASCIVSYATHQEAKRCEKETEELIAATKEILFNDSRKQNVAVKTTFGC